MKTSYNYNTSERKRGASIDVSAKAALEHSYTRLQKRPELLEPRALRTSKVTDGRRTIPLPRALRLGPQRGCHYSDTSGLDLAQRLGIRKQHLRSVVLKLVD